MTARDDPQPGLAKALREFRNRAELSQEALGISAGLHATWISHIESGRVNPTYGSLKRIAEGLGIELWELVKLAGYYERGG